MNPFISVKRLAPLAIAIISSCHLSTAAGHPASDKDGTPLWSYLGAESPNMPILYHKSDGTARPASFGIEYKRGKAALQEEIAKDFWRQHESNCDTMHVKIFYCILFDEQLNIEEIRFQKVGLVDKFIDELEECGYFELLEKELSQTKGQWIRKESEDVHIPTFVYFGWVIL